MSPYRPEIGRTKEESEFWSDVDCYDFHWYWVGDPTIDIEDIRDKAWTYTYAPILKGWHIEVWCDEEYCVRPQHMFVGKTEDAIYAVSRRYGSLERVYYKQLSDDDIWKIEALLRKGFKVSHVAKMFNTTYSTIAGIKKKGDK